MFDPLDFTSGEAVLALHNEALAFIESVTLLSDADEAALADLVDAD